MLYYCAYTWYPGTTRERVAERFMEQEQRGLHHQDHWRGWYSLAGGGAGFMIVETDTPQDLTEMLQPYMDLMSWDVRAIYKLEYEHMRETLREFAHATA